MNLKKQNNQPEENSFYETERLIIQPVSLDDAAFILELHNSPNFIRYIGDRGLRSIHDAEQYINKRFIPQFERSGFGNYVITEKYGGKKVGAVGIFEREGLDVADIGFSFLGEFEGRGYGFEAATKVKSVGMVDFGLTKLSAITTKDNFASQKLIGKLGLKFKKYVTIPNDDEELMYFETE
ncbi:MULTISPECIES: GNAT family N-acetyltransferase [Chryseobacterium]|uniref:Ribosomal-protein-alanine N-acetyltransferase n=1 Tax=Chryseobacterium camelliae TaxID=1265445 RepID=A0ABU0TM90_9FLAO|nr:MULTISPECIES: GNAT family N-acetyltransferase [Chryseobacterium]MDT3407984.1 ribosomal-protein-alanine N-acetyltransferase [Pseudacidovorax intermedius]MDQ1098159.1 ribosomal-protein-alanine N-acetyltransferase [Chryseobacterium camelliae]MDQ1102089.1 ribosomal-protein-alanine N-acetyltransferase [Chryseobacterium sp. SORGH_AS_1048]MDR6085527.1 ribosomal-protein-alanine N-acetyltransferase [Chryseobacterium sp. SORGH_AS_0909]MDR6129889.1 ribosomal-protein-alanine N-acetyltransferase [Chryse